MVADVFHFYAGAVDKRHGETIPVAGGVDLTFREPLGVVGLIVPWNFPLNIASWKLGPALACGNTVVLKPAELTPLSALRLAELALEAGIPEGVVNVVVGKGSVVGRRLVEHPDVAKIGFTGSTEVGRAVMRRRRRDDQARHARARRQVGQRRSSPTPTSNAPPRPRRTPSSTTPARTAAHARASSSSAAPTTASPSCSSMRRAASRSATRPTTRTEMGPLISAAHRETRRRASSTATRSSPATRPTARASGSRARSSRRRTTTASRARRSSARSPR